MKYLILIFIVLLVYRIYEPVIKGKIGEWQVAFILSFLNNEKYKVINDVMLPTEKGTTQIDHIVVSKYGIFVIETKNYKGLIYGNEFANEWTKNMYGRKYKFYNPLKQNFAHIKTLSSLLGLEEDKFTSIIIFPYAATIKHKYKNHVTYFLRVNKIIKHYNTEIISDVDEIVSIIRESDVNSKEMRKKHIEHVNKRVNEVKYNICPECGYHLKRKKGKYGYFTGCSNYPECKYVKKR